MKALVKVAVGLSVLAGFLYLFLHTARDARAEPYTVGRQFLRPWTLSLQSATRPTSPLLVVTPPEDLGHELFNQIFQRMMESMRGSIGSGIPLVLRDEYELALAGRFTPHALLEAARQAGLESADFTPVCVAGRRISEPGRTRQVYFAIFDAPAVVEFRQALARELSPSPGGGLFDPTAVPPALIVAATDEDFDAWLPLQASADSDCVAPIVID